jgi:2-haloalkanoic acid dehalogenase type II
MTDAFAPFRALSFDCYGTLIDWETGIVDTLRPWAERHGLDVSREELLDAFSVNETAVQSEQPSARYPEVLAEVMRRIGDRFRVEVTADEATTFGDSVGDWPPFDDSHDALTRLSTRFALIILSNVDRMSFVRSNRRLGMDFDRVITAEDVGSYKPSVHNFEVLISELRTMDVAANELLHVAESLYHDHVPAKRLGLSTVWINRRHAVEGFGATPAPDEDVKPDWQFPSLGAFADAAGV